jgi:hypothetical protein
MAFRHCGKAETMPGVVGGIHPGKYPNLAVYSKQFSGLRTCAQVLDKGPRTCYNSDVFYQSLDWVVLRLIRVPLGGMSDTVGKAISLPAIVQRRQVPGNCRTHVSFLLVERR